MVQPVPYGPTSGFELNLLLLDFHRWGFMLAIAIMQERQQNKLFTLLRGGALKMTNEPAQSSEAPLTTGDKTFPLTYWSEKVRTM